MVKKEIFFPTILGWSLLSVIFLILVYIFFLNIHNYLSLDFPIKAKILVIEGWIPDYALKKALNEFKQGNYNYILTTGVPLEKGKILSKFETNADLSAAILIKMGINYQNIIPLPATYQQRNRTYASALKIKEWILANPSNNKVNLLTLGTHARRSYNIYKKILPENINVGVIAVANKDYDSQKWWLYSAGVKSVIFECIALIYTEFFNSFILQDSYIGNQN